MQFRSLLAVVIGGIAGTAAHLALEELFRGVFPGFPLATVLVNVSGSLALGFLVARVWPVVGELTRVALGPGFLGSYTTFSSVMVSVTQATFASDFTKAAIYLGATLVTGFAAAGFGLWLGRRSGGLANPVVTVEQ